MAPRSSKKTPNHLAGRRPPRGRNDRAPDEDDPPPSSPKPSRPRGSKRASKTLIPRLIATGILAAIFSAIALGAGYWIENRKGPGSGASISITVSASDNISSLAPMLEERGLIRGEGVFSWYLRLSGRGDALARPGQHVLADNLSAKELVSCLARDGRCPSVKVTFPEGWNRFEMARRLQEKGVATEAAFLSATVDRSLLGELEIPGESAEGYLFPATYSLPIDADAREVVKQMKAEFDRRLLKLRAKNPGAPGAAAVNLGWAWHDVITLASIVEKEAAVDEERATIASVFLNRLLDPTFTPRLLQSDPTAVYGCLVAPQAALSCATFAGKATPAIIHDPANRYSTYAFQGLPPGPIANPGERSLQAVIAPSDTHFLYFVAKGGGRHVFSSSLAEHNDAIRRIRDAKK